ncbi:MAG: bifunctional DNA-formamidopyrimidine glycosylase/DNA-(apurinic or apyrimidinic site) lyase [Acidobacteria bacterium]|nr:bifunctional DNA-formamidopyrimidine glycosylase/DNA-(apurinic or apyrimidinic site) lyase [Acidobacteriota bacterium]MCA1638855.1 bifunctional DNA-formamidopyrimidine glycosylase/DNA-(apurinic or apyrimidinic site) lyase [Acidobacteriota bacterium]
MPELPEVELVAKSLDNLTKNRQILTAELLRERLAPFNPPEDFSQKLKDSKITGVHRRGKHILFDLNNGQTLITHLRMSGRFLLLPVECELPKFTHAVFYFSDETRLVFSDQRHFGYMRIVETEKLRETKELKNLAPEPFSDEFNQKYFRAVLKTSKRSLKEFLLDQTKVCGLGNIYAAEAMFLARVNPQTPAHSLSVKKAGVLLEKIREVLAESIVHGSTLNINPENIDGSYYGGGYESSWRVYDREKQPCVNCRTEIERLKQGGRSSYFCPKCQK